MLRTVDSLGETGTDVVYEIYHDILARAVVEWQDRKARRSDTQLRHLEDLREQLSAVESLVERGDAESTEALYPLLQTLAAELQALDPVLADRARELAARLVEGESLTRSSRSASVIERKQVKLLQDEVQLLMRSGAASEELAFLYTSDCGRSSPATTPTYVATPTCSSSSSSSGRPQSSGGSSVRRPTTRSALVALDARRYLP